MLISALVGLAHTVALASSTPSMKVESLRILAGEDAAGDRLVRLYLRVSSSGSEDAFDVHLVRLTATGRPRAGEPVPVGFVAAGETVSVARELIVPRRELQRWAMERGPVFDLVWSTAGGEIVRQRVGPVVVVGGEEDQ